jgi:hypothetical protein
MCRLRTELQAEAANLRSVVQEQSAQVAALKQHAERMEAHAETAQAQVGVPASRACTKYLQIYTLRLYGMV